MKSRQNLVLAGYSAIAIGLTCASSLSLSSASAADPPSVEDFDWESIKPKVDLEYHDCYDEFKCARLQLPLDWLNETDTRTTAVAIIKLPAVVPQDDPSFSGPIFTNPGGPGGSGVQFALNFAYKLRSIADKPGHRHYDVLSFDPRGIGNTTPRSDCYHHDLLARDAAALESRGNGPLDRSPASLAYGLAMVSNFGRRCKDTEEEWGDVMPYVGTPSVARDMVEMIDKIEELRKSEAADKNEKSGGNGENKKDSQDEERLELKKRRDGHDNPDDVPRLQYIGFSYGTVLGNYFASLFPGRVGRVILDGVCNTDDYATGPGWLTNTVDTDEIFDNFLSGCHKAGPSVCDLARKEDSSVMDLSSRFWSWVEQLDESPQATHDVSSGNDVIISGADVLGLISTVIYSPIAGFKITAYVFDQAMRGNTTSLAAVVVAAGNIPQLQAACPVGGNGSALPEPPGIESQKAVLCGDGDDITDKDAKWWREYVHKQLATSTIFGAIWSTIRLTCASWPFRANWSFKGPFTTPKSNPKGVKGVPAAPLLFLSNRLDPVTPLSAARAMAAQHPGAAVVVQEAMGHCAVPSAPSDCTRRIVADYFDTGAVPSKETACETSCGPWDDGCKVFDINTDLFALASSYRAQKQHSFPVRKFPLGI